MMLITLVWFLLVALVVYHHVLYPLLLKRLSARWQMNTAQSQPEMLEWPSVSLVIPCYNEGEVIAEKLHNLAFLDYPEDRLEIVLVDDGSTDDTLIQMRQIISKSEFEHLNIQIVEQGHNQGKVAALNKAMTQVRSELVVLSDTSALISIDALRRAAQKLSEPKVGVVCGTYQFLEEGSSGEQRYWQYQTELKNLESKMGSTLGAHGALYAFRTEAYESLPADTINDDFILPMTFVRQGYRCVYDTEMVAVELETSNEEQDFSRRQRIAAGNLQQALRLIDLLHPKYGWVAFNFASGKWLRAFMPFILLSSFLLSAWNPTQSVMMSLALWGQSAVYSLVVLRFLTPKLSWPKAVNFIYYLVQAYVASGIGAVHYLIQPDHFALWQRATIKKNSASYLSRSTLIGKRLFDITVATIGIVLTLPVWPLIALAIKLESKGPVLFRQMRIGKALPDHTELFEMMKFRTMAVDAESKTGAVWAAENDPRITRIGKFLRKTRLDELPQLLNVLRGDMSLVGPRPERPGIGRDLDRAIPYYAERTFFVTPGITGLAQVNQGYDTCLEDVKNKLLYDHAYALSLSAPSRWIRMDLHVAFKTVWVMVAGRGQ